MITLFSDERMINHRPKPGHPEKPERLEAVLREVKRNGLNSRYPTQVIRPATDAELLRVHTPNHLRSLAESVSNGGGQVEEDTWVSEGSEIAARLASGAVVEAVKKVLNGQNETAVCLVRPPGHHARPDSPMGFCLYGNIAVGAADAIATGGLDRVMIIDWDVHHGNGTQEMFYDDPRVAFFSVHRYPFYPGTGSRDESGTSRGLGMTRNLPLPMGIPRTEYLAKFRLQLETFAASYRPQLLMISAGFDAHAEDPVGNLGLEVEDFITMTQDVMAIAEVHTQGRIVSVLEGGYNVSRLAGSVVAHIKTLGGES